MKSAGFTLLEIIIVLAMIGILAAIGIGPLNQVVSKQRVTEAQHNLTQLFTRARSDARRTSNDQTVTWNLTPANGSPTFTLGSNTISLNNMTITMVTDSATAISEVKYEAPTGRRSNASNLQFAIKSNNNFEVYVRVIGLTGKVVRDGG
jgi:type IV pilus assembly protein PilA